MSTTIDNRVVAMQFDNRHFEKNVSTTMTTLDKLKQKLNFSGASKGLEDVGTAAKKVDMIGLGRGIEVVQAKFSALQVMGITALTNITNQAVNAGKRIASALTIKPIRTGFQEYETQMGAIQTILANTESKGSTLQDVNKALNELNTYADKTIYNFTEMTKNIGTFTAAGVDLDKSVTSIKGIANLAAISGSTSMQASTAMYQLSQALAAGRVSLMDWNSVVNAGMGGEVFQTALKRTAKQMGQNVDGLIEKYGSFRESLTQGNWLTTEVLTETLTQLSGAYTEADLIAKGYTEEQAKDIVKLAKTAVSAATEVKTVTQLWDTLQESVQSGWTQSWQTIVGDFGEAKELLTGISNALGGYIGASADARNKVLTEGLSTGWKQLLTQGISDEEGFKDSIKMVAKERGVAIDKMIEDAGSFEKSLKSGWLTGDILTESIHKLTQKISGLSEEQLKEMGYTTEQVRELEALDSAVTKGTINLDEFAKKMSRVSGRENMIAGFKNIFEGLLGVLKPVKEAFRDIFPAITGEQLYKFTEKFKEFTDHLKVSEAAAKKIKTTFKGVFSVIDIGVEAFKTIGKGAFELIKMITGFSGGVLDVTASIGGFLTNMRDSIVEGNIFGNVIDKITGFISNIIPKLKEFGSSLKESISSSSVLQGFFGFFKGIWDLLINIGSSLGDVFGRIGDVISEAFSNGDLFETINSGLLAGVLLSIRKFITGITKQDDDGLNFLDRIKDLLDGVKDSLETYQQDIKAGTLLKIAGAIGIMAAALFVISGIDSDKIIPSLTAIGVLFGELATAMFVVEKMNNTSLKPIKDTVSSLSTISKMISIMGLGVAVVILSGAMKVIASLDWDGVKKGLIGIGGIVGILVAAARLMNTESKSITKFAGQMVILSVAVGVLSLVSKQIASLSWDGIKKAGVGIFGLIGMLVGAAKIMDSEYKSITKFAGQMLIMSAAVGILTIVAKNIASLSWGEIAKSGVGIFGLIGMLVGAAKIMNASGGSMVKLGGQMIMFSTALAIMVPVLKSLGGMSLETIAKSLYSLGATLITLSLGLKAMTGSLSGSAALLIATTAILALTPALKALGGMSLDNILKSLIAIAGAFAILGIAALALQPIIPAILGLAGGMALISLSAVAFGVGVTAIAAGFAALSTSAAAGATALVAAIGVIVTGLLGLIPAIARIIGELIVEVARNIGEYTPQLAEAIMKLIVDVLASLAKYTPMAVDSILEFLIGVINSLSTHMPDLIQAVVNLIGSILRGVISALNNVDTENLINGIMAIGLVSGLMYVLSGVAALIPSAMIGIIGVGAVIAEMSLVLAAIGALSQIPGLEWLVSEGGDFLKKVGTAIGQFIGGIAGGLLDGVTSSLPDVATNLSLFMMNLQPFIIGAKMIDPSLTDGVRSLVGTIMMLTAADILQGIASFITGGTSLSEFGKQLVPFGKSMQEYSQVVSGVDTSAITASASAAKALAEVSRSIPAEGGLWGLLAGEKDLGSFGEKLIPFGQGMKEYASVVTGINSEAIVSSASAAKALATVAKSIPAEGGLWGLLAGEKDLGSFGEKLIPFGQGMKDYSIAVLGLNAEAVKISADAAKAIVEVADAIPPSGGLWDLLAGSNDLGKFGEKLIPFANGMKEYAITVLGINTEAIIASANAAKAIVEVADAIPPTGGLWGLLAGDKDLSKFGEKFIPFGNGLKEYAITVLGIDTEAIIASATAAKALVEVAEAIPPEGGLWDLLAGEQDLGKFGEKLLPFGQGMKDYAIAVLGIDTEAIIASATAAKALVEVAEAIPPEGGLMTLITGDKDLSKFGEKFIPFGNGLKDYAISVLGIDTEAIIASVTAAKALMQVAEAIPPEGGLWGLLAGDVDMGSFGKKFVPFGQGLKDYSITVLGVNNDAITKTAPSAEAMVKIGKLIYDNQHVFAEGGDMSAFKTKLSNFGIAVKDYGISVLGVNHEAIKASASSAEELVKLVKSMTGISSNGAESFVTAINKLGEANVGNFVKAFSDAGSKMTVAGANLIESFKNGVNSKKSDVESSANTMVTTMVTRIQNSKPKFSTEGGKITKELASGIKNNKEKVSSAATSTLSYAVSKMKNYYDEFYDAGGYLVKGFASGISSNSYKAAAKAKAMASDAYTAAKKELDINSPSKVFRRLGYSVPEGLAQGIERMTGVVKHAAVSMADSAIDNASSVLSNLSQGMNGGIDVQPRISPVLDLDNVKTGAGMISKLLNDNNAIGVSANVGQVSALMSRYNQNGRNENVVSAINKLRKDLENVNNNTYTINGVTYDDGSNVSSAVEALIGAIRLERRS